MTCEPLDGVPIALDTPLGHDVVRTGADDELISVLQFLESHREGERLRRRHGRVRAAMMSTGAFIRSAH